MSRILHLSDVHLGEPSGWQYRDAQKVSGIAAKDRRAQKHVLRETLEALDRDGTLARLDAVVISGDLTNGGREGGFEEFAAFADILLRHVDPRRILVVPGNHDVPKDHGPGDPARYDEFLRVTRDRRMSTPLLDGRDFDATGELTEEGHAHPHLIAGDDFVVIALNSSHFCWGSEPLADGVVEDLLSVSGKVEDAVNQLRSHDVARVSNAQMTALERLLREREPEWFSPSVDDPRVRVAVLHHQLLPVSAREEFKDFESLTNLGAVRELLASLGVRVVLHGHKHESALYWDYVADHQALTADPHRMLVSAAPGEFKPGQLVARIVEVGPVARAREIEIHDIAAAAQRGGPIVHRSPQLARLWEPVPDDSLESRTARGRTPSDTYARIQSLFRAACGRPLHYLVCEVEDPSEAERVPHDYPPIEAIDDVQRWMTDLVDWWQLREPRLGHGVEFNHGDRIFRRWGDQAARVVELLNARAEGEPATTRATILLLDPHTETGASRGDLPSFVLVQLQLVRDGTDWRLDCMGYFRKQEMRYWWPINVAELARIQREVADGVRINEAHPRVGRLRTITAYAVSEERLPAVAVPAVDRAVDQDPDELWRLAYGLIAPERVADPDAYLASWRRYLSELEPDPEDDREAPRMSRRGLQMILGMVRAAGSRQSPAIAALDEVVGLYGLFDSPSAANPETSRAQARARLASLQAELGRLVHRPRRGRPSLMRFFDR